MKIYVIVQIGYTSLHDTIILQKINMSTVPHTNLEAKRYISEVTEDPETGELVVQFDPELMAILGWHPGDTIIWNSNSDGTYSLVKKGKNVENTSK